MVMRRMQERIANHLVTRLLEREMTTREGTRRDLAASLSSSARNHFSQHGADNLNLRNASSNVILNSQPGFHQQRLRAAP